VLTGPNAGRAHCARRRRPFLFAKPISIRALVRAARRRSILAGRAGLELFSLFRFKFNRKRPLANAGQPANSARRAISQVANRKFAAAAANGF
jgi:hypothetical protein